MAKQGRKTSEAAGGSRVGIIVVVLLVVAALGTVAYFSTVGEPPSLRGKDCTPTGKHEHASFAVFAHNTSISWDYPQFYFPKVGVLEGHIHAGAPHTLHMEGGATKCTTVSRFFMKALLTSVTEKVVVLDKDIHGGVSYKDGDGGKLRFFVGEPGAEWYNATRRVYVPPSQVTWREEPALPHHQPLDGEYLLVTFGNENDAAIRWQQLSIPVQVERE